MRGGKDKAGNIKWADKIEHGKQELLRRNCFVINHYLL
jgi:hypothetical protein